MKKKWSRLLAIICYTLGTFGSIYVGAWMMLLQPIHQLLSAFSDDELTLQMLIMGIIKITLSTTVAGTVFTVGYIGYNHFKGTDDPDWEEKEEKIEKQENTP